jgi:hypothetical protein
MTVHTTYIIERRETYFMTGGFYWAPLSIDGEPSWPSHSTALAALDKRRDRLRRDGWHGLADAPVRIVCVTEIRSICP